MESSPHPLNIMILSRILITVALTSVSSLSCAAERVTTCSIGGQAANNVDVVRDTEMNATHIYYLRQRGKQQPFFGNIDASRGSDVYVDCVGTHRAALVVSGEFTANALQGFVLASRLGSSKIERLDFAEKARPGWLYIGKHDLMLVAQTDGFGDQSSKYVVYRKRDGRLQVHGSDTLPSHSGFNVLRLKADAN